MHKNISGTGRKNATEKDTNNSQTETPPEVTAYATLRMGYTRIEPLPGGAHV